MLPVNLDAKVNLKKVERWLIALIWVAVALSIFIALGVVSAKIIGIAGSVGLLFIALVFAAIWLISRKEES